MKHDARDVLECSLLSAASDGARFVAEIEARAGAEPFRLSMQKTLWGILRKHAAKHEHFAEKFKIQANFSLNPHITQTRLLSILVA